MVDSNAISTLTVPTANAYPSVRCVQWSRDGQLLLMMKSSIYILTPHLGLNFDVASVTRTSTDAQDVQLNWYRNLIDLDTLSPTKWPEISQDWGALSLGSLDISIKAICPSPTDVSSSATCVLAVLTSNMDLSIWAPSKNVLKGEWNMIHHYTAGRQIDGQEVQEYQITSITWTGQADFGLSPSPLVDASLLIAGTRAGTVSLFRFGGNSIERINTVRISDYWISQIAVSPWVASGESTCEARLAINDSSGQVIVLTIKQTLNILGSPASLSRQYAVDVEVASEKVIVTGSITVFGELSWISPPSRQPILVFGSPGVLHLWSPLNGSDSSDWVGLRSLKLTTQRTSVGSSALYPPSGVQYLRQWDVLLISLFDGSIHVIHNITRGPTWDPPSNDNTNLTTEHISKLVRSIFEAHEPNSTFEDVGRIGGMSCYDSSAVVWVHESCRPSDFSYKHEAKHTSMLIVTRLFPESGDDAFLADLEDLLRNCKVSDGASPHDLLRPIFRRLNGPGVLDKLHSSILRIIQPSGDPPLTFAPDPYNGVLGEDFRACFRRCLREQLFGSDRVLSYRLRLAIADHAWKIYQDPEKQAACGRIAQTLLDNISHHILRAVVQHLMSVTPILQADDIPFIRRLVVQSNLPRCPPDLTLSVRHLAENLNGLGMPISAEALTPTSLNESCPACGSNIPFQDIITAQCENRHSWSRCSVTSFILSTTSVRTAPTMDCYPSEALHDYHYDYYNFYPSTESFYPDDFSMDADLQEDLYGLVSKYVDIEEFAQYVYGVSKVDIEHIRSKEWKPEGLSAYVKLLDEGAQQEDLDEPFKVIMADLFSTFTNEGRKLDVHHASLGKTTLKSIGNGRKPEQLFFFGSHDDKSPIAWSLVKAFVKLAATPRIGAIPMGEEGTIITDAPVASAPDSVPTGTKRKRRSADTRDGPTSDSKRPKFAVKRDKLAKARARKAREEVIGQDFLTGAQLSRLDCHDEDDTLSSPSTSAPAPKILPPVPSANIDFKTLGGCLTYEKFLAALDHWKPRSIPKKYREQAKQLLPEE
ncbi:hypothetical protein EYR36_010400 [Pleurotus pulmonarius]|nr:hypothetical protein EYR36_010400 [Pleurotus pulmonarius]